MPDFTRPLPIAAEDIVDTVREPLLVLDADLRVQRANRSFYRKFKVSPEDTEGRLVYDLGNGQWDIPTLRCLLEEILPHNNAFDDFEVDHDFESIGRKVMLLNARRVYREGNHSESIVLAIEDITERRHLEDKRAELETRFSSLVKNIRDHAIFTLDSEGKITTWNHEAERILGYQELEVIGQHFSIIFSRADCEAGIPAHELCTALKEGRAEDERWHLRKNGERFWALGIVSPTHDINGRHTGYAEILRDMTHRKKAEEEALFRATLLDRVGQAVIATSPDGKIVFWNHYAEELYRFSKTEAMGRNVMDVTVPKAEVASADAIMDMHAAGQSWSGEFTVQRGDGTTFPAQVTNTPILDDQGRITAIVGISTDLSEQNRAKDTLRHSEERFRNLMEQAPFSIQIFSPDGRTLSVNRAWEKLWGLKLDQIPDYNVLEDPQLDSKGVLTHIQRAFAGDPSHIPAIPYDPNETIPNRSEHHAPLRWVSAMAYPLKDESGKVREVVLVHEDITERKKAEAALRQTEERLRLITDSLPTLISYVDSEGIYRLNNRAYEQWFGHSRHELTGRHMRDVLGESAWSVIRERIEAALSGHTVHYEAEVQYRDAGQRWIDATYVPHFDNGNVAGLFVLVNDITDRKRAEKAVRESEALFRNMADNAPAMLWITDPTGYCNYLSAMWYQYTGRTPGIDAGYGWLEAVHPDDLVATKRIFLRANEARIPFSIDYRVRRYNGEYRWVVDAGLPRFEDGTFQGFVGCVFDVHERKSAEDANSRLVADLQDADRRKDEFLATLAHELRNPLAPIRNSLQILKLPMVDAETIQRSRDMMERQVLHLVRLVDDLLDVSRVMRGKIELRKDLIELAAIIARAVETVQPLVEAQQQKLNVRVSDESLLVNADSVRLTQVIGNLLTNAAKYTETGGEIWLTAKREGNEAVLRVQDNGIGIARDMLLQIFELFVQVDHTSTKAQGGLGIGLTLARNLVQMHDGSIEAQSDGLGMGSEFIVRLPIAVRALEELHNPKEVQQHRSLPTPTGHRLLVVDDNQDAADSLAIFLKLQGHEIRVAYSGSTALDIAKSFKPHAVFLDIGMPEMDGFEVARRIRQEPDLEKVVLAALTGWGQREDRLRTLEAGFDHHLVKPAEPKILQNVLAGLKG